MVGAEAPARIFALFILDLEVQSMGYAGIRAGSRNSLPVEGTILATN